MNPGDSFSWKIRTLADAELLRLAASCGIKNIFLDWSALNEFNPESDFPVNAADSVLRQFGLRVESFHSIHGAGFDLGETGIPSRERAVALHKLALSAAARWGARSVTFHLADAFSPEARAASCESIGTLLPWAERHGVAMALENMKPPYYGKRAEEIAYFLEKFPSQFLGVCYDVGHANIAEGVFPVLEAFAGQIATVHVHDNLGEKDQHLPLGLGNIPWQAVFRRLEQTGYANCFACESRPSGEMTWQEAMGQSLRTFAGGETAQPPPKARKNWEV